MRNANREATRKALGVCVEGRDPVAAAALVERRSGSQSVLQRRLSENRLDRDAGVPLSARSTVLRLGWEPRTHQDATIVVVCSDEGIEGYASGDAVPDRALLERLLEGLDVSDTDAVHELVETADLHHGRNWIVEVAVWDLLGRADEPLWRLLGGERDRIGAYASSGELVGATSAFVAAGAAGRGRASYEDPPPLA